VCVNRFPRVDPLSNVSQEDSESNQQQIAEVLAHPHLDMSLYWASY